MSQTPAPAAGQVSADGQFRWDGQQWVPIPKGEREATPWTRPMQLAVTGFFVLESVISVLITALTINHDSVLRVMQAQGSVPPGTDVNTVANFGLAIIYAGVGFFVLLQLIAAFGSYLRWRWMFWTALVLLGLGGVGAITNLGNFASPGRSYFPVWGLVVNEVISLGSLALFVWLLVGAIRYGPWAMKKPGT